MSPSLKGSIVAPEGFPEGGSRKQSTGAQGSETRRDGVRVPDLPILQKQQCFLNGRGKSLNT